MANGSLACERLRGPSGFSRAPTNDLFIIEIPLLACAFASTHTLYPKTLGRHQPAIHSRIFFAFAFAAKVHCHKPSPQNSARITATPSGSRPSHRLLSPNPPLHQHHCRDGRIINSRIASLHRISPAAYHRTRTRTAQLTRAHARYRKTQTRLNARRLTRNPQ